MPESKSGALPLGDSPKNPSRPPLKEDADPGLAPRIHAFPPVNPTAPGGPALHGQTRKKHTPRIRSCGHRHIVATIEDDGPPAGSADTPLAQDHCDLEYYEPGQLKRPLL